MQPSSFFNSLLVVKISLWAIRDPHHAPPTMIWSSKSGIILFKGLSGTILAMLPEKMGQATNFGHFSKWPPQNLRFPLSRKFIQVGSWFGGSKPILSWSRNQMNMVGSMADHYYVCTSEKPEMATNVTLDFGKCVIHSVLFAFKRLFWYINLSFHVSGF